MNDQLSVQNADLNDELNEAELEAISGGIIIVGGSPIGLYSRFSSVMLNPQPLPPKVFGSYYF